MVPYADGLVLNSAHKYGIETTQALFDFSSKIKENYVNDDLSHETHMNWIFTQFPFEKRSHQGHTLVGSSVKAPQDRNISNIKKRRIKRKNRRSDKTKNCILKMFKKNRKRRRRDGKKMQRKFIVPFILGLMTAKSLLIPVALKILAFVSTKGLMMGFFSTALASLLSLKGLFEHSHGYKERKDDTKTQVEIIHVPSKNEDHIYYDDHYTKGDYVPIIY